jgi:hypothetical protein
MYEYGTNGLIETGFNCFSEGGQQGGAGEALKFNT